MDLEFRRIMMQPTCRVFSFGASQTEEAALAALVLALCGWSKRTSEWG
jgi:hypothetical protein